MICARQRVPLYPDLNIHLASKSLMSIPSRQNVTMPEFYTGGIRLMLCDCTRKGLLEACAQFPPDFIPCIFAGFTVYCFAIISHSHEYNYVLSLGWLCGLRNSQYRRFNWRNEQTSYGYFFLYRIRQFLAQIWEQEIKLLLRIREENKLWQPSTGLKR